MWWRKKAEEMAEIVIHHLTSLAACYLGTSEAPPSPGDDTMAVGESTPPPIATAPTENLPLTAETIAEDPGAGW